MNLNTGEAARSKQSFLQSTFLTLKRALLHLLICVCAHIYVHTCARRVRGQLVELDSLLPHVDAKD